MSAAGQISFRTCDIHPIGPGVRVVEYKLYCLDRDGRIVRRHEIVAADDVAAIAAARAEHPEYDCEVWSGTRKVALVPAGDGAPVFARPVA